MKTRRRFISHLNHKTVVFKKHNGLVRVSLWRWIPPQSKHSISLLGRCRLVFHGARKVNTSLKGWSRPPLLFHPSCVHIREISPFCPKNQCLLHRHPSYLVLIGCVLVAHVSNNSHQVPLKAMTRAGAQSPRVYNLWDRTDIAESFFDARLSCLL